MRRGARSVTSEATQAVPDNATRAWSVEQRLVGGLGLRRLDGLRRSSLRGSIRHPLHRALLHELHDVREADLDAVELRRERRLQTEHDDAGALDVEPALGIRDRLHQLAQLLALHIRIRELL